MPPFAYLIKLIASPTLANDKPGSVTARMGFLRILGRKTGTIGVTDNPSRTSEKWMAVIASLLPPFLGVMYDTGSGVVELYYNETLGDADQFITGVRRLIAVGLDEAHRFLRMERDELDAARERLRELLAHAPIDIREQDGEARLREMLSKL